MESSNTSKEKSSEADYNPNIEVDNVSRSSDLTVYDKQAETPPKAGSKRRLESARISKEPGSPIKGGLIENLPAGSTMDVLRKSNQLDTVASGSDSGDTYDKAEARKRGFKIEQASSFGMDDKWEIRQRFMKEEHKFTIP